MIVPGEKYLLAILNSKIADFYIRSLGVTRNGGYFEYKPMFVQEFPAVNIHGEKKEKLESIVDTIISADNIDHRHCFERDIDAIVYSLYELTADEINYLIYNS